jgi:hypothetical protein
MGLARLLAKGWILICLFAGAHAFRLALMGGGDLWIAIPQVAVSMLLFAAMGLLFVCGYGVAGNNFRLSRLAVFRPVRPGFNDIVFLSFVLLSFLNQVIYAPNHVLGGLSDAFENALYFVVPGQRELAASLTYCGIDGGRVFASSFTWLLAIVFAGSAVSRLKLAAGIIRLDRTLRPQTLNPTAIAAVLGIAAVIAVQCLFVGADIELIPCSAFVGVPGALLTGLAPLMFAYLIYAALAALLASGSEK